MDGISSEIVAGVSLLHRLKVALLWPLHELLIDGRSRFFWAYVVSGLLITLIVGWRVAGRKDDWQRIFALKVWWSASARNDYLLVILRPLLALTIMSWALVNVGWIADGVAAGLRAVGVRGTVDDTGAMLLGVLLTISLFVVDDFLKWSAHTVFHKVPALWEFHKVHHSAEELNFTTADRIHPVELFASSAVVAVGLGITNGLFIALAGARLTPTTVAGANILLFTVNIFGGVLRHSPFWLTFGPRVERWIISPAQHQIHHSEDPRHFDTNMGVSLAIWDRMAGTLRLAENEKVQAFGIGEETRDFRSFGVLLFRPFAASLGHVWRALPTRRRRAPSAPSVYGHPPRA